MERMNFVKNGVLRLPPGFRFHPTDEELVVQYLKRKIQSSPMPAHIIPEIDVCKSDPWDLPGEPEKERFFFSTREIKYPNGSRSNRATGSGYWKATGLDKQIVGSQTNQVVGMKKTLVFYRGKPPTGVRTDWIMHEYRLATPTGGAPQVKNPIPGMEDWVLCRIFLKKRGSNGKKKEKEGDPVEVANGDDKVEEAKPNQKQMPVFYEFLAMTKERSRDLNLVPGSSSSGSSGITTNACGCGTRETDEHEESCTDCNDVSTFKRTPWT